VRSRSFSRIFYIHSQHYHPLFASSCTRCLSGTSKKKKKKKNTTVTANDGNNNNNNVGELQWLEIAEEETFHKRRGVAFIAQQLRQKASSKNKRRNVNTTVAVATLQELLYRRHALRHGKQNLKEMTRGGLLSESFLGPQQGNKTIHVSVDMAKTFLKELWRYGKSQPLEHLQEKVRLRNENRLRTQEAVAAGEERKRKRMEAHEEQQKMEKESDDDDDEDASSSNEAK